MHKLNSLSCFLHHNMHWNFLVFIAILGIDYYKTIVYTLHLVKVFVSPVANLQCTECVLMHLMYSFYRVYLEVDLFPWVHLFDVVLHL